MRDAIGSHPSIASLKFARGMRSEKNFASLNLRDAIRDAKNRIASLIASLVASLIASLIESLRDPIGSCKKIQN